MLLHAQCSAVLITLKLFMTNPVNSTKKAIKVRTIIIAFSYATLPSPSLSLVSSSLTSPTPSYYSSSPSSNIVSMQHSSSSLIVAGISSIINSISPTPSAASYYPYSSSFVSSNEIPLETSMCIINVFVSLMRYSHR